VAVYGSALDAPFYYDDHQNIVDNPHLRAAGWSGLWNAAFGSPTRRPVAYLSFALNQRITGLDPAGFRRVNIGIHALAAVAVALLARMTLARLPRPPPPGEAGIMALLAGLLFALHPVQTQSVTYVVQRMSSLAALFYVAALLAWLRGRLSPRRGRRVVWWTAAALSGLLALGSKEVAVTLPAAIWLYEWAFFRDFSPAFARRSALLAGIPLALLAVGLYLAVFQGSGYAGRDFSAAERLLTSLRVVVFYASLVLWPLPSRLNLLHEFPLSHSLLDPPSTLLCALLLAGAATAAVGLARRAPLISFALAWVGLHLALESFVLPLALVYEHRLYLPLVGFALVVPWALLTAVGARPGSILAILLALALGAGTWARNEVWRDELVFWSDAARKSPDRAAARNNHGLALQRAGHLDAAIAEYRAAVALDPDDAEAHDNLGAALLDAGRIDEARATLERALAEHPDHARAHYNLGRLLALSGRLSEGARHLETAVELAPWDAALWNGLGAVRELQGRLPESARAFERALALDPGHAQARHNLEVVRARLAAPGP
jgi:Flp pilus assembly protein TadD